MICKNCEHYFLCANDITNTYEDCKNKNDVEKRCLYFKDKSTKLDLPCKVGDTVYCLQSYFDDVKRCSKTKIKSRTVDYIPDLFECDGMIYTFLDLGKTVFLTKEQAEKALEELNNE